MNVEFPTFSLNEQSNNPNFSNTQYVLLSHDLLECYDLHKLCFYLKEEKVLDTKIEKGLIYIYSDPF